MPDSSRLSSELNAFLKKILPQDVFAYAMPLAVTEEFRDGLLKQSIALKVADGAVLKRQCEYLAGRFCANESLKQFEHKLAIEIVNKEVATGKNREPLWPQGVLGAISHSSRFAMAVVAQDKGVYLGVGIDIEEEMAEDLACDVSGQIMTEKEKRLNKKTDDFDNKSFVTLVFSAKESIFKALYPSVGEYFGFEACELCAVDVAKKTLNFRLTGDLSDAWKKDTQLEVSYLPLPNKPHLQTSLLNPSFLTHQPSSWLTFTFLL